MTAQEYKMVGYFAKMNELRPQLSAPPFIRFKNKKDDLIILTLEEIKHEYESLMKQASRDRAREKRQEKSLELKPR